jgi:hypothetical protein
MGNETQRLRMWDLVVNTVLIAVVLATLVRLL